MRRPPALLAGLAILTVISLAPPSRAESAFLTLRSRDGRAVEGEASPSVVARMNAPAIECVGIEHLVAASRDEAPGQPAGRAVHGAFRCTKRIDKSSPLLARALVNAEGFASAAFKLYRSRPDGTPEPFYTVTLDEPAIVSIRLVKTESQATPLEEVAFAYRKITWTYAAGGTSVSADDEVRARSPGAGAPRATAGDCNPPYRIDAAGIRHYNLACMDGP